MKTITTGNTAPTSSASSTQNSSQSRGSGFAPTAEQQAAINGVLDFALRSSGNFASLVGPAGAGKTWVTKRIKQALTDSGKAVGLAAPTHKACGVLAESCGVDRSEVITVAALLGLKELKTEGEVDFVPSGAKSRLGESDIWLIDEASMISKTLLEYIESDMDMFTKVIFIGDSSQLSPVGSSDISPALQIEPSFKLTKVLRHGGAILEAATEIRETSGEIWRPLFTESSISHGQEVNL